MFSVVLWEPEIPPNTGNLMRLTVNTGCSLHLIEPLGFTLEDARMRRAGLDYREFADVERYPSWSAFVRTSRPARVFAYTQHADRLYTSVEYQPGDTLLFGKESTGLSEDVLSDAAITDKLRIPIAPRGRSLNLANAAAIAIYEAWRQNGFAVEPRRPKPSAVPQPPSLERADDRL
jgi:tRNA (cytidine/uridine-2'-O-)-methyltransferase